MTNLLITFELSLIHYQVHLCQIIGLMDTRFPLIQAEFGKLIHVFN